MKMNAAPRILIVAALCVTALVSMVVVEGAARQGGEEVLLPMEAVDPRSLLSGHYVLLNLTQRLEPGETCPTGGNLEWIALRQDGDVYTVVGGAESREQAQLLGLPVRGEFTCNEPIEPPGSAAIPGAVTLNLGIDRFHITQTEALRIEDVLRAQSVDEPTRAFAIVSIGREGRGRLKGLLIDGERLELNWL